VGTVEKLSRHDVVRYATFDLKNLDALVAVERVTAFIGQYPAPSDLESAQAYMAFSAIWDRLPLLATTAPTRLGVEWVE
jgi:hypothetical protein